MSKRDQGVERRRAPRRPLVESFSLFVVVPKKGGHRLPVHDVSELGIGFDADLEGEGYAVPLTPGEQLELQFYLNQTLFIPLQLKVVRVEEKNGVRRIGAEFADKSDPYTRALGSFVAMLDAIGSVAQIG